MESDAEFYYAGLVRHGNPYVMLYVQHDTEIPIGKLLHRSKDDRIEFLRQNGVSIVNDNDGRDFALADIMRHLLPSKFIIP